MENTKSIIAILHSFFDVLWRASVAALIALFILNPASINTHLTSAGFTEGSVAGFKWKAGLEKSDIAVKDLRAVNETLVKQLKETQGLVAQLKPSDPSSSFVEGHLRALGSQNEQVLISAADITTSVSRTISLNETLVSRAQAITGKTSTNWGVVFGASPTKPGLMAKIDQANESGYNARIYRRNNFFARMAQFTSQAAAEASLDEIRINFRRKDAYVVNINTWCIAPKLVSGVIECN